MEHVLGMLVWKVACGRASGPIERCRVRDGRPGGETGSHDIEEDDVARARSKDDLVRQRLQRAEAIAHGVPQARAGEAPVARAEEVVDAVGSPRDAVAASQDGVRTLVRRRVVDVDEGFDGDVRW